MRRLFEVIQPRPLGCWLCTEVAAFYLFIILLACGWQLEKRIRCRPGHGGQQCESELMYSFQQHQHRRRRHRSNTHHLTHHQSTAVSSLNTFQAASPAFVRPSRHQHRNASLLPHFAAINKYKDHGHAHHQQHHTMKPYQGPDDPTFPGYRIFLESRLIFNVARYQTPENYKLHYYGRWSGRWQDMWLKEARERFQRIRGGKGPGMAPTSGGFL